MAQRQVGLSAAVDEAAEQLKWAGSLRCDRDVILARYWSGTASEEDLRRYRAIRLALALHDSPARRPHLPCRVDEVLQRRSALIMELMMGSETAEPPVAS